MNALNALAAQCPVSSDHHRMASDTAIVPSATITRQDSASIWGHLFNLLNKNPVLALLARRFRFPHGAGMTDFFTGSQSANNRE
jgi:hypothetical protein